MAEFRGNNQPTALPTGHRPPCQVDENLVVVTPDQDWGRRRLGTGCGSAPLASAKHLPWHGKVNGRGNPLGLVSLDHHWAVADAGSTCTPAGED